MAWLPALTSKAGKAELRLPTPPRLGASWALLPYISPLSQGPTGLHPFLPGSLTLGGETEVRMGPGLSESAWRPPPSFFKLC